MPASRICGWCGRTCGKQCRHCHNQRYGAQHQRLRRAWTPIVALGTTPCHRDPTHLIDPTQPWDLDHPDSGGQRLPSCAYHNRQAGAITRNASEPHSERW